MSPQLLGGSDPLALCGKIGISHTGLCSAKLFVCIFDGDVCVEVVPERIADNRICELDITQPILEPTLDLDKVVAILMRELKLLLDASCLAYWR